MIAALLAALGTVSPGIVAGLAALAATLLTLALVAIRNVFKPKGPTIAQLQVDATKAQAGQVVAQEQAAVSKVTATAAAAMGQAVADAPTTQAEVVDSLNKGEF